MNDPRNNVHPHEDHALDGVLRALDHVQPRPGFHDRLLTSLETRSAAVPASTRQPRLSGLFPTLPQAALAASALVLLLVGTTMLRSRSTRPANTASAPTRVQQPPSAPGAPAAPAASSPVSMGALPPTGARPQRFRLSITNTAAPETNAIATAIPSSGALDDQAIADLHAPSQPASPLALTAQERMVRLMLRRGEKHDLAQLDAGRTAAYTQREQAAFSSFFDPPPPPESVAQDAGGLAGSTRYAPPSVAAPSSPASVDSNDAPSASHPQIPGDPQ